MYIYSLCPIPIGGLGEAVAGIVASHGNIQLQKLGVHGVPASCEPQYALDRYGIGTRHIIQAVHRILRVRPLTRRKPPEM